MDIQIKPIPTVYNGYRFRSRLEARWAVFMDAAGIPYSYEPEGFDLGPPVGFYLPDFWLPQQDSYIEIKPGLGSPQSWPDDRVTATQGRFEEMVGKSLYIICGEPGRLDRGDHCAPYQAFVPGDCHHQWCECPECGAMGLQYAGRAERNRHMPTCSIAGDPGGKVYGMNSPRLCIAYDCARSARFEHGERPDFKAN